MPFRPWSRKRFYHLRPGASKLDERWRPPGGEEFAGRPRGYRYVQNQARLPEQRFRLRQDADHLVGDSLGVATVLL